MSLVRDIYRSQWFPLALILVAIWIFVTVEVLYMEVAKGQEPDYRYACQFKDQFPFWDVCAQQRKIIKYAVLEKIANGGCDIDDEAYNVTGRCDPDEYQCFATKKLAEPYIKEFGNHSDVFVPCKSFKLPTQKDESGK